jgi:YbbR domain-containing protein
MSNKTVVTYSDEEFSSEGMDGKKARRSFFIPLICSIAAAFALWLFVVWGNNTCTGIPVQVVGNEQLMSSNYTVSSIEPANIDLVFRGKTEVIKRISKDPSLVTASVSIFGTEGDASSSFIFDSVEEITPGEYTVELKFVLPEGVSCNTKSVKVTIAEAGTKDFSTADADLSGKGPVRLNMSNFSFANGISLEKIVVVEENISVIGDQYKVDAIDYIALKVDWLKDLSDDAVAYVTPVACDKYGDVIDSEFLHFEPSSVQVNIKVNKQKIIHLVPKKADGDSSDYTLSVNAVRVIGSVLEIDKLKDVYEVPIEPGVLEERNVPLEASKIGSGLRFMTEEGERNAITLVIKKTSRERKAQFSVKAEDLLLSTPPDVQFDFDKSEYQIEVLYVAVDPSKTDSVSGNAVVSLDLSKLPLAPGVYELPLKVSFTVSDNVERYLSVTSETVKVRVLETAGEQNG